MRLGVLAHALAFGAEHQGDTGRPQILGESQVRSRGKTDPPEARRGDVVEGG